MKFRLKAYNIYELGQRANQEDSIYPKYGEVCDDDRLFVLCDGMGGHESGEVASAAVCEAMSKSVLAAMGNSQEGEFTDAMFEDALSAAYASLDEKDNGAAKKMGTTMTFLKLHKNGCTIAHIGDSRVYHIRPGKDRESTQILFQTEDHSLINNLIKIGELTPEEAKTSKQKNVITRAMQPNMNKPSKADIHHITDIRPGDFFYMCTDGMLEEMEDDNIRFVFSDVKKTDEEKVKLLVKVTENNRDNHSAFIVHILDVEGAADPAFFEKAADENNDFRNDERSIVPVENKNVSVMPVQAPRKKDEEIKKSSGNGGKLKKILLYVFFIILCIFAAYGVYTLIIEQKSKDGIDVEIIDDIEGQLGNNTRQQSESNNTGNMGTTEPEIADETETEVQSEVEEHEFESRFGTGEVNRVKPQDGNEIKQNNLTPSVNGATQQRIQPEVNRENKVEPDKLKSEGHHETTSSMDKPA